MPTTVHTYVIRIMGPDPVEEQTARAFDRERRDVVEILRGRVFGDIEDIVNDALPENWYCKVVEWDSEPDAYITDKVVSVRLHRDILESGERAS